MATDRARDAVVGSAVSAVAAISARKQRTVFVVVSCADSGLARGEKSL